MTAPKVYFPNLNGLRFIAALLVIIHHIEQLKSMARLENDYGTVPFVEVVGKLGVILFFVLSGFLITYLLLAEESAFNTVSVRKFYLRRVFRIWPLYFLIILLAFAIIPNISALTVPGMGKAWVYFDVELKLGLYLLFLPNLVLPLWGAVPYASHLWSIGTEEQFYLVWPIILKYLKRYRILFMMGIVAGHMAIAYFLEIPLSEFLPMRPVIRSFWTSFAIDCMAIGGIYAILLFQKNRMLSMLMNRFLFYGVLFLLAGLTAIGYHFPFAHYECYSVLFGIVILNLAANNSIGISLENPVFSYLGNISYGLYMFHPLGIYMVLVAAQHLGLVSNWVIYPASLITTITLAGLSYRYFETFFLRYKDRFTRITSGSAH